VRFHADPKPQGAFYEGLQKNLSDMEARGNDRLSPLPTSLANRSEGCLSIGLYGPPDTSCTTFKIDGN
jgi:hypothetical protein